MTQHELLKCLCGYFPHQLQFIHLMSKDIYKLLMLREGGGLLFKEGGGLVQLNGEFKPILRPLSDLTKEIEHEGERFVPADRIPNWFSLPSWWQEGNAVASDMNAIPFYVVQLLYGWHFDIYNLIDQGLAVNYNEIER